MSVHDSADCNMLCQLSKYIYTTRQLRGHMSASTRLGRFIMSIIKIDQSTRQNIVHMSKQLYTMHLLPLTKWLETSTVNNKSI